VSGGIPVKITSPKRCFPAEISNIKEIPSFKHQSEISLAITAAAAG
jgi:hypothetical protein